MPRGSRRSACTASAIMRSETSTPVMRAPREDARVVALATSGVENLATAQVAEELEERRIVQPFAGDVAAPAYLLGPRGGVRVPVACHLLFGESVDHQPM